MFENISSDNSFNSLDSVETIDDFNFKSYQYKKYITDLSSILGKRNLQNAFGNGSHDEDRYGRVIHDDFFKNNIGHNVIRPSVKVNQSDTIDWRYKLGVWREKYKK